MSNTILKIENLSKQYRLGQVGTGTLVDDLKRWWFKILDKEDPFLKIGDVNDQRIKGVSDYVWAIKDLSFEVKKGEVLGIIGKNGAGKSTLLKILSKITSPTTGSIKSRGRIASLLEVGTGFHGEMTGKENVYLNGAILGMTKKEISKKYNEIVEFSGCERYIDTPVKRYSSGMTVRLAFAVAAFLEPDILIIDEVLAVGDSEFQKKAIGKMQDISKGEGRTVLFVSHNMAAVRSLCTRCIVLENGGIAHMGEVNATIDYYLKAGTHQISSIMQGIEYHSNDVLIESIMLNRQPNNVVYIDENHSELNIQIVGELFSSMKMAMEVRFYDEKENLQMLYTPGHLSGNIEKFGIGKFEINETVKLPNSLTKQEFLIDIDITHPNIEYIIKLPRFIKIVSKGIVGKTGIEFTSKNSGFMLLK
jgi:lipopolysaccharide transport system ATP-binding protein